MKEWDPQRKLVFRIEVALESLERGKDHLYTQIRNDLLGVNRDTAPMTKTSSTKRSVANEFNLQRVANAPRFEVSINERTDELKPSRLIPRETPPTPKGKYHLAVVTLEIPLTPVAAPAKPAESPKDGTKEGK